MNDQGSPRGKFIVLEGGEGAGKSSACVRLQKLYPELMLLHEPGTTDLGLEIRRILLDNSIRKMAPRAEFLLFWAARAQLLFQEIGPALASGRHVLCDRFVPSTFAYQIRGRQMNDVGLFNALERGVCENVSPDLYIFLDIEPELGMQRATKRGAADRMEQEKMDFHRRVYEGYQEYFSLHPHCKVDARRSEEDVFFDILSLVKKVCGL